MAHRIQRRILEAPKPPVIAHYRVAELSVARPLQGSASMHLSVFNLYVEDYPEPGSTLVHNTFSGAYVVLDDETLRALRKLDAGEPLTDAERELTDDPDFVDTNVAILVESHEAEEAEFIEWFEWRRSRTDQVYADVSINMACNFDCPYCYQADVLDGAVMSEEVADQTADWLVARAMNTGARIISLSFLGGEPLLHPGRIRRIATRIRQAIAGRGIEFQFSLTTNGYFLSESLVVELARLGLTGAQITLDGDETTHSKTRVSKKGEDTFQRIFNNTVAASRHIRIRVNGNYSPATVGGFAPLLAKLADAGLAADSSVRFTPAMEGLGAPSGSGACTWAGSEMNAHVGLQDEILRCGFERHAPVHVVGPCEFHEVNSFAVDQNGDIQKCPGFQGRAEWRVGHVSSGLTERFAQMLAVNPQRGCAPCSHRPNCGGGCIAIQWVKTGRMEGVNCERGYFDRVVDDSVPREYLLATEESVDAALERFPSSASSLPERRRPPGVRPASLRVVA